MQNKLCHFSVYPLQWVPGKKTNRHRNLLAHGHSLSGSRGMWNSGQELCCCTWRLPLGWATSKYYRGICKGSGEKAVVCGYRSPALGRWVKRFRNKETHWKQPPARSTETHLYQTIQQQKSWVTFAFLPDPPSISPLFYSEDSDKNGLCLSHLASVWTTPLFLNQFCRWKKL